ncbi:MAG: hypothetical protein IJV08_09095 [Bacteroidaceae bacterium]|nr:hypothetical protein [Bacteroidaceae bacterium]
MKHFTDILRGRPGAMLLAVLFAWLLPQQAAATYVDEAENYVVELGGSSVIYFTAPVYDQSGLDTWIYDGNLLVSVDGGAAMTIFHWEAAETGISDGSTTLNCKFSTTADGFFDITLGNTRDNFRLNKSNGSTQKLQRNSDGRTFEFSAEWSVPYNMLGKKLKFTWNVNRDGTSSRSKEAVAGLQEKEIAMPAASAKLEPFVSLPMLSSKNPGKLEVPWFLASDSIVSARYEYTDGNGVHHEVPIENVKSSTILLDANVPYRNFRVVCSYKEANDKGSYLIDNQGSTVQNIPLIHTPIGLSARQLEGQKLKVEVKWDLAYPDDEDLTPMDFFEIQRSLTGLEQDFVTVHQDPYISVNKKSSYIFVDSTLTDDLTERMLTNGGSLDNLTYRVRRTVTQDWNWAKNSGASSVRCVVDNLHLLNIASYSAKWEDERAYTVRVSWNYADEPGAVWDDRAQMVLRVVSRNSAGQVVDSLTYRLEDNERRLRYKVVELSRSCVHYDIDMYVERGESPLNYGDQVASIFFPIRNAQDWHTFAVMVNEARNTKDINARLYADITTSEHVGVDPGAYYRGVFDGNGHTLTFNKSGWTEELIAPFRYVGNATIRNLHTAGTISSSKRYLSGLVGWTVEGTKVSIENCRSSVELQCSANGEGNMAGFIARQSGADVVIRNCKFDGSFEGANTTNNRGFVARVARGSSLVIENSVFAPSAINTKFDGCETWVKLDTEDVTYSAVNNYATRVYSGTQTILIRNAADWEKFTTMVYQGWNKDYVDAILVNDITIDNTNKVAGEMSNRAFYGTFDGNGHTITVNHMLTGNNAAPFLYVGIATFKNLRVAGAITSYKEAGGFVGRVISGGSAVFENCRSSVTLTARVSGDASNGGFVRFSEGSSTFRNCMFDGSFEGADCHSNGGFVGWATGPVNFENCLFMPASIGTNPQDSDPWARGGSYTTKNCYATNEFCHVINNAADWETFRKALGNRGSKSVNAILNADITVSTSANDFKGVFDGNGHTLTLNGTDGTFISASDYTIKNLHVTGSMGGDMHVAGLVGSSFNGNIQSCRVNVNIHCNATHAGGFIGHGHDTPHTINNCLFDGSVSAKNDGQNEGTSYVGAFLGWVGDADHHVTNCLEDGNYYYVDHAGFCYTNYSVWGNKGNSNNNYSYKGTSWDEVHHYGISHDNVASWIGKLGDGWYQSGDKALPKMTTRTLWNNVGSLSASDLASKLGGSNWKVVDGKIEPVLFNSEVATSEEDIAPKMGDCWKMEGDVLVPVTTTMPELASSVIAISTAADWQRFRDLVQAAKGQSDVNAVLMDDIETDLSIGWSSDFAYRGTFNGNGHTIDFNIDQSGDFIALFRYAKDYTLKNLRVTGSVKGGIHSAGLVGHSEATSGKRNTLANCHVSVSVESTSDHAGGFIGHGFKTAHTLTNCLFDGSVTCQNGTSYVGTLIGWGDDNSGNVLSNCLENGGNYSADHVGMNYSYGKDNPIAYGNSEKSTNNWTYHDWAEANHVGSMAAEELAIQLGSDSWQVKDGKAVPQPNAIPVTKCDVPDFYHKNTGTIDPELLTQTRQSSVLLTWNTDGAPIDYFRVMRRVKGEGNDKWQEVATNLDQLSYEDTSVSPLLTYEYKVLGVNDCEGIDSTETQVKVGECKHTGRLDGYVRFNDGTSAAGIEVDIFHDGTKVTSVRTDDSGHYVADELSYYGGTSVEYEVSAVGRNGEDFSPERTSVTFDAHSNDETLREIAILNGKRFSGYVMYNGTSIPVKGANFKVNGRKVYNTKGKLLETDYDGSFSFRVLPGNDTIQVVMDGHNFTQGGYFKSAAGHNFTDDVSNIYFYDDTKVKLTGRVVGGDEQGQKPLLNNLSTNNLGDSLTIVLTLEGDNTSWLVYDNLNPNRTEREEVIRHPRGGDKHFTTVKTQRKRMTVWPDAKTGEYMLQLPPVRWKVQQVYCKGYPTLFQEGQVSEVIDLTDSLTTQVTSYTGSYKDVDAVTVVDPKVECHAIYNRIYHSPVEVTYRQLGYDTFNYFGDKNYMATELSGEMAEVPLAYLDPVDSVTTRYSFGYPVFSLERKYTIELQVGENYLYNNDPAGKADIVRVGGGIAMMQNDMKPGSYDEPVLIDSLGRARFTLQAGQTTNLENSLRTVTFTVMRDGTYLEAKPLQGYVLNMYPVGNSKDIMTEGNPVLIDILRDPPGAYSSNTLAKGATLNYTYMMNLTLTAGLSMWYKSGKELQTITASVEAPQGLGTTMGVISAGKTEEGDINELMYSAQGSKAFSYTMAISNNISTSGDPSMVGADADLYIGAVQNVVVTPMSTVRAVTKKMFDQIAARQGGVNTVSEVAKYNDYGTVVKIAEGLNAKGDTVYLIRDVALGYGPKMQSQFIYSQKQILTQIIPNKAKEIVDMMFCGTKKEAQDIADKTGRAVYWSLREPTDSMFAVVNKQLTDRAYNYNIDKAEKGINYMVVIPTGCRPEDFKDEVTEKYQILKSWTEMIAQNEMEKLRATDLLTNYDIAGAQGVNYSETFDSNFSNSWTHHFPIATEVDYFGPGISYATSAFSILGTIVGGYLASMAEMKYWTQPSYGYNVDGQGSVTSISFTGDLLQWRILPVALYSTVGANSEAKAFNRTESFTIATDPMSRLNVDVYRVKPLFANSGTESHNMMNPRYTITDSVGVTNIFTNYQFDKMYDLVEDFVGKTVKEEGIVGPRGFVFRTRGGATQNPWEDQRTTNFYDTGRELDARTLKIVNPKIRLDKQSVSGVSVNDAAHFTVYVSNESEKPEATENLTALQLFAADQLNPLGAKISINGQPLTTGGMAISVVPGKETALQMEVRAGQGFDFDGLTIGVMSPTDAVNTTELVSFNVHFLREAGGVSIAVPGDKWVLNTNAQMDADRGWYLPVTINGFDRHQYNFDHIEFQYKESQRGDDSWTNLCSFYADETLMANANGVRKLIPENGNIVTEFYGEGWTMERAYDLRAVLFCRNGSDFLTTSSKVISGVKDTRRPQLFGTPEPKNGLLTQGDDIVFNFSEDIEYNYLSAITNFEVKGEVNNNAISEMVSVEFTGKSSVESEAKRNFSGKDLTIDMMVKPADTGRDMPLFSHGSNGDKLQLWLTKDFKLKGVVNDQEFTSDSTIVRSGFTQVAMALNQKDSTVTFFNGGVQCGNPRKLTSLYNGTGALIFGRTNESNRTESQYYEGRMMEARLWYSAMDGGLIGSTYGSRRLTGYEKDLVDYYPMNEGSGDYVIDYTQGANAQLMEASWAIPHGWSLHLKKADKGMLLDKSAISRTDEQDYTLMFWFKTDADGRGALLSNGRGVKEDNGAKNLFHIGFQGDILMYRSNGFEAEVPGNWSDGQWHHFAMTVNRARNVANIYVDKEVRTSFEADSLGGISGGYPLIGATRYDVVKAGSDVEVVDGDDALEGYVDELLFFAQALPQQLIKTYSTKSPNGDEAGLLTYLSFDRQERQKDNSIEMVPYAYSKKLYLDDKGEPRYQLDPLTKEPTGTLVRDYVFVDEMDAVLQRFDQTHAAPVVPYEEVKNLKFSFIGSGKKVLVELDESAARLNHRNIYVTLRDIEDKNGNTMASPQTACYYVNNSNLQWLVNRADTTVKYGTSEEVELPFYNNGATSHTYTIENCPRWLTLNKYSDVIAPQSLDYVNVTVSKDLNIGTYNEIIYLTDEEGITEPFYLNLTVEGEQPEWAGAIDGDLLRYSMSISGQVYLYDELDTDSRDIVGVFDNENVCHGFANITHDVQTGDNALFLTVYDGQPGARQLYFRLWQYSTGREIVLTPDQTIFFQHSAVLGTDKPVRFDGGEAFVQNFNLKRGWNWVSFNVEGSEQLDNVGALLTSMPWKEGDILTDMNGGMTLVYTNYEWISTDNVKNITLSPKKSYAVKVQQDCIFPIAGTVIKDQEARTIELKPGWNGIGYTPMTNLTVETALSDYLDQAMPGDVIKSHTEFAYFTKAGNTGRWRGSLQYMKPGEGYMMLRQGAKGASFTYPYYELNSNFREDWTTATKRAPQKRSTMSVSATVSGFEPEEGDRLVAYADGEVVGSERLRMAGEEVATAEDMPLFYLSIAGDTQQRIWFAIERDGEIVASTDEVMTFKANAVIGSPDEPTAIDFVRTGREDGKWYTIGGVMLQQKPKQKGLYIFNGKKFMIK